MMVQMNCRGFATAQFMQPEPAKYSKGPTLEATTFMQPEHPYFAHHPGRFFYVRDNSTADLFSAPYEPVRAPLDRYCFINSKSALSWLVERSGVRLEITLTLAVDEVAEIWEVRISNFNSAKKALSLFPYFSVGYLSWMNQSASYDEQLNAIVANSVTPYQKVEDYFKNQGLAEKTFLAASEAPSAWTANMRAFEGDGGLHNPDALGQPQLPNLGADYELPAAIMQYDIELERGAAKTYRFAFGPAKDRQDISRIRENHILTSGCYESSKAAYAAYIGNGTDNFTCHTPDIDFDHFINHWLPRQVFYHGDVNRLTTDPQTRNYLQDHLGMSFIKPEVTRESFLLAFSQQKADGEMPDGILLRKDAELKYINQVPHADHNVWLPICLKVYLDETGDYDLLNVPVAFADSEENAPLKVHMDRAMEWLFRSRDERGLSYIHQGDWCDPMNMVGYKGKGVSGWLTMGTAYALLEWASILEAFDAHTEATQWQSKAKALNEAINTYLWDGDWYARGITDNGIKFGTAADKEGRIFLNAQSWALLCGAANSEKREKMLSAVADQLHTPYGPQMLAPAFTGMRDDVGRVTQKHPGSAENGSVYNHAAIFYIFSLLEIGNSDLAYDLLVKMLPSPADAKQRGQMPNYIPNYYRGAYKELPRTAGKSSQLFNTGTVAWYYRCVIEGVFGLQGTREGLMITPQLPSHWNQAQATRRFRGATFEVEYERVAAITQPEISVDGTQISGNTIVGIEAGNAYRVHVQLPKVDQGA